MHKIEYPYLERLNKSKIILDFRKHFYKNILIIQLTCAIITLKIEKINRPEVII